MKNKYFNVPSNVANSEAADLYRLMAIGECERNIFLDKRHQIIFDHLTHLKQKLGVIGTLQLISYLIEQNLIDVAGGESYVNKIFCGLEPAEVYA